MVAKATSLPHASTMRQTSSKICRRGSSSSASRLRQRFVTIKIVERNATGRRCRMSLIPLPLICFFGRFRTRISGSHPSSRLIRLSITNPFSRFPVSSFQLPNLISVAAFFYNPFSIIVNSSLPSQDRACTKQFNKKRNF